DETGSAVAKVGSLLLRPIPPEQLEGARRRRQSLYGLEWTELSLAEPGEEELVTIVEVPRSDSENSAEAARTITKDALESIQNWLADDRPAGSRLALITPRALPTQREHPHPG